MKTEIILYNFVGYKNYDISCLCFETVGRVGKPSQTGYMTLAN